MSIQYYISPNNLANGGEGYVARVLSKDQTSYHDLIELIKQRGSTLTRTDIQAVLDALTEVVVFELQNGRSVSTPFCNFNVSIRGIFNGDDDAFDKSRHKATARANAGAALRELFAVGTTVEKQLKGNRQPHLLVFEDSGSGSVNDLVTPGQTAFLRGADLVFDPADPEQGVFFVKADNTEIRIPGYARIKPGEITFLVPVLDAATDYNVELRTKYDTTRLVSGELNKGTKTT